MDTRFHRVAWMTAGWGAFKALHVPARQGSNTAALAIQVSSIEYQPIYMFYLEK